MSLDLVCSRGWIWKFGSTMVFTPNMRSGGFAAARDGCPAGTIACWYSRPSIDGICWWMDRRRGQLGSQNDLALHTNSPTSSYTNWHHSTWEAPLRKIMFSHKQGCWFQRFQGELWEVDHGPHLQDFHTCRLCLGGRFLEWLFFARLTTKVFNFRHQS